MNYSIKFLTGFSYFQTNWNDHKDSFFDWCIEHGDDRWRNNNEFVKHMRIKFINSDEPITCRLWSLDENNLKTVIRYIEEVASDGLAELLVKL